MTLLVPLLNLELYGVCRCNEPVVSFIVICLRLECLYHGWKFDGCSGRVSSIPTFYHRIKASQATGRLSESRVSANAGAVCLGTASGEKKRQTLIPVGSCVQTFPCVDKQGFVWVWLGTRPSFEDPPWRD